MIMKTKLAVILVLSIVVPISAQTTSGGKKKGADKPANDPKKPDCKAKDTVCNYIVATRQLLAGYQTAIQGQVDRLQHGYAAVGQIAEEGRRDEIESDLRTERNRRSELMTDELIHQSRPVWHWKEYLLDYAAVDFKSNRELLELNSLDGSRFVQGLQNLGAEFSKVQTLDKLLAGLNEKKSLTDSLKELGGVAQQTKTQFDTLVCAGLKKDLAAKQAQKAALPPGNTDQDAALKAAIDALTKERASKSCTD
jgi:hypothetical protein